MTAINNRYEFMILFDAKNCNPNGDPDAFNKPRINRHNNKGLVSPDAIKRKIRNHIMIERGEQPGYDIFMKDGTILNHHIDKARGNAAPKKEKESKIECEMRQQKEAAKELYEKFFDIRTFGAVLSTGKKAGQVRGPVQISMAESVNEPFVQSHAHSHGFVASEKQMEKVDAKSKDAEPTEAESKDGTRNMSGNYTVNYALYVAEGYVSPYYAKLTGFSQEDLDIVFDAIRDLFRHDVSAARTGMCVRKLIIFKHDSFYGNAQAMELFERVKIMKKEGVESPGSFSDYVVSIDDMPDGVTLIK